MGRSFLAIIAAVAAMNLAAMAAAAAPAHRAAHARGVEDPRAFVMQRLASYRTDNSHVPPDPVWAYSPRLAALFRTYDAWQHRHHDEVGSIDFDWWINAQDWELTGISASQADSGPNARTVTAHWRNSDRADSSRFLFVRIGGRWYLDDVINGDGGENSWVLSQILQERPE